MVWKVIGSTPIGVIQLENTFSFLSLYPSHHKFTYLTSHFVFTSKYLGLTFFLGLPLLRLGSDVSGGGYKLNKGQVLSLLQLLLNLNNHAEIFCNICVMARKMTAEAQFITHQAS